MLSLKFKDNFYFVFFIFHVCFIYKYIFGNIFYIIKFIFFSRKKKQIFFLRNLIAEFYKTKVGYLPKSCFNLALLSGYQPRRGRPRSLLPQMGEFDLSLIEEFRSRRSLYDRNSPQFKDKVYNAQQWHDMSNKLGFDGKYITRVD